MSMVGIQQNNWEAFRAAIYSEASSTVRASINPASCLHISSSQASCRIRLLLFLRTSLNEAN
jgi:hypothetical protein